MKNIDDLIEYEAEHAALDFKAVQYSLMRGKHDGGGAL